MLVSDKYQFIIGCPTKTGTHTMRSIVDKFQRGGGDPAVLRLEPGTPYKGMHRLAPPDGLEDYKRYMMVREPVARLVSCFEFLRRRDYEWKSLEIQDAGDGEDQWLRFLGIIAEHRVTDGYFSGGCRKVHGARPWMWTDRQSEMLRFMQGWDADDSELPWYTVDLPNVIQLEMLSSHWGKLLRDNAVDEPELHLPTFPVRNSTGARALFYSVGEYKVVAGASSMLQFIVGDDAEELGYIGGGFG